MRLTDVCNRLTTRAPCGLIDSRASIRSALRPPSCASRRSGPKPEPTIPPAAETTSDPGGASLDGDPPASALDVHAYRDAMLGCYPLHGANEIPLGPGGCRDRRPLRRYPSDAVFSTALRAGDIASDALVAPGDLRPGFRPADLRRTPDPLPPPPRQRQLLPQLRAPSIDECSLHLLAQTSRGTRHRRTTLPSRSGFRRPFAP
jgi:hypothetical protein